MVDAVVAKQRDALGLAHEIDSLQFPDIVATFNNIVARFADEPAFTGLGRTISYRELDEYSDQFAAYIQNYTDLQPGDRVAVQLPNLIQYPVVMFGVLKAGMVLVNTNPLYTQREIEHQFNDSGAKALVVLVNIAEETAKALPNTGVKHVITTELADLHPNIKRFVINNVARYIKKMVPDVSIANRTSLPEALKKGARHQVKQVPKNHHDLAVLQYTGGTTGVAKGAMLSHGNLLSNTMQCSAAFRDYKIIDGEELMIQPLPLYHIYAFISSLFAMWHGAHVVLIPNPRDLSAVIKELRKWPFSVFCGLNTLFVALCNNADFRKLDFSRLKVTLSGGMALTTAAANEWKNVTGCQICEGYGLTEASPVVSYNPQSNNQLGTIGMPLPSTRVKFVGEEGEELPLGEAGELCVHGPQIMQGYWQRPEETEKVIKDGWLLTGDIAMMRDDGYIKIVDRKKDMVVVSGFNVYPNELEDVLSQHPAVVECAAIGIPDEKTGEAVKMFVVKNDPAVTAEELIAFCREKLTAYKVPKLIEFRDDLPKTNVGKILRRELRDS